MFIVSPLWFYQMNLDGVALQSALNTVTALLSVQTAPAVMILWACCLRTFLQGPPPSLKEAFVVAFAVSWITHLDFWYCTLKKKRKKKTNEESIKIVFSLFVSGFKLQRPAEVPEPPGKQRGWWEHSCCSAGSFCHRHSCGASLSHGDPDEDLHLSDQAQDGLCSSGRWQ